MAAGGKLHAFGEAAELGERGVAGLEVACRRAGDGVDLAAHSAEGAVGAHDHALYLLRPAPGLARVLVGCPALCYQAVDLLRERAHGCGNPLRRGASFLGEALDLTGHDREPARRLDTRIQREEPRLLGDTLDGGGHGGDLPQHGGEGGQPLLNAADGGRQPPDFSTAPPMRVRDSEISDPAADAARCASRDARSISRLPETMVSVD